ncbi:MAG: HD-GYP domain-containing protein [Gammaproteobacteria bacterium]|nr:HD-GYP domain-containing protein [Gammaproteobacteria bacterium]
MRIKVHTMNVQQGMYVAQLDRSWLETPFLFQGFEIHEEREIGLLRKFCKHVYVDVERSTLEKNTILAAHQAAKSAGDPFNGTQPPPVIASEPITIPQKLIRAIGHLDPTGIVMERLNRPRQYKNLVTTAKEAPRAADAYATATAQLHSVVDCIKQGIGITVETIEEAVTPMIDSVLRNQNAMAWLVYLRKQDEYAYNHAVATSVWAVIMGRHLGFDRHGLKTMAMGGILLDVGKTKIPDSIIQKATGLTQEESAIMEMHVKHGVEIARQIPGINDDVLAMIECHHERHDGSGYPEGLVGADIPVYGRIAGVADCYDAMISDQPHQAARSSYDAIRQLNFMIGTKFQKQLIEQFVQALGMFPTGSLVELNTGEVAIVIEQNRVRRLRPKVMLVLDRDKNIRRSSKMLDLQKVPVDEGLPKARWITHGHEAGAFGIDPNDYFL